MIFFQGKNQNIMVSILFWDTESETTGCFRIDFQD